MSRKRGQLVSESEAAEVAFDEFVEKHCPVRKAARKRAPRKPSEQKKNAKPSRKVPAAIKHTITEMHGDQCFVEECEERTFLDLMHRIPLRLGGGSELSHFIGRGCKAHHAAIDSGRVRIVPTRSGAILVALNGTKVGAVRRPRPPPT